MGVGKLSLVFGKLCSGEVRVRRLLVYTLWALGLGWLVIWGISAMVRDSMPTGVVWAFLSMVVWWLVGGAAKEDSAKDN
jgi:hypothetical protein